MTYELLTGISKNAEERARFRARRKFEMDLQHNMIVSFEEGEIKGKTEESEKWQKVVEQKDAALAKTLGVLADKDVALAKTLGVLADKDAAIADKDAEIARLRELLGGNK
jgi:hypothetical protein